MKKHYLENDAIISKCGKYRYLLRRAWDYAQPRVLYIMLNPSTADAIIDDPTTRSCVRLADGLGFGSMEIVNVCAYRATNPKNLLSINDPVGPNNLYNVGAAIDRCDTIVCAWGASLSAKQWSGPVLNAIRARRSVTYCFGRTKEGAPRHPLYIKSGTTLEIFTTDPKKD